VNAFEQQAMQVLGRRLADYPEETRRLGRLDDRVVGWMMFRPHVLFACAFGAGGAAIFGMPSAAAGGRWLLASVVAFAVLCPSGWALGRWVWRRSTLPHLEVLADAAAAGRGQAGAAPMPVGEEFRLSAAMSRLRRLGLRAGGPRR
jgi:hypothetical protein